MSPARVRHRPSAQFVERRTHHRYPMDSELQCKVLNSGAVYPGHGVDISSGGTCLVCSELLPIGTNVEISVDWPVRLSNGTPLQLKIIGYIIRHDQRGTATKILRYSFHTRKSRLAKTTTEASMADTAWHPI